MDSSITIRPYQAKDKAQVITVFKQNTPDFFDPTEQKDLEEYLQEYGNTYFVMLDKDKIIGCGGYHIEGNKATGRLSWDFFDPKYKGEGLGRQMINHCLEGLNALPKLQNISVWTSQLAYQFYAKFGFEIREIKNDYWGPGLDLYRMEMSARSKPLTFS